MPVISFEYRDFQELLGENMPLERFMENASMMGLDIGGAHDGMVELEVFPNRPDNLSVEGLARSARAFFGVKGGAPIYNVTPSGVVMNVDASVASVRPYVCCGIVRNVVFTDSFIKSVMEVQEKLHTTLGRKRAKVAIGIHDMAKISGPFTYSAVEPRSVKFAPLGFSEPMDMKEILERHDKGREYARILEGKSVYPIIRDRDGKVLSFPPIINGNTTEVREDSQDILLDVTGMDELSCRTALNILATLFAERGAAVQSMTVKYPDRTVVMPDLSPSLHRLSLEDTNRLLGLNLTADDAVRCLSTAGMNARAAGDHIDVDVPAWRNDILHPVDLMEDVAIGYGFMKFTGSHARSVTFGSPKPVERASSRMREFLVGLGYLEVMTQSPSNADWQFKRWNEPEGDAVRFANPINEDMTLLRTSLLPSILAVLRANKHRDLPQRIFELDDVAAGAVNRRMLAGASTHSKASFTEAKSVVEAILNACPGKYTMEAGDHGGFIRGRYVIVKKDGEPIGRFGEVHPMTLEAFDLGNPLIAFEFELEPLAGVSREMQ